MAKVFVCLFLVTFLAGCNDASKTGTSISEPDLPSESTNANSNLPEPQYTIFYEVIEGFGEDNEGLYFAIPLFVFNNNQFSEIPTCISDNEDFEGEVDIHEKRNCELVDKIMTPNLINGQEVYVLENGNIAGSIKLKNPNRDLGFYEYNAEVSLMPRSGLLTNNPRINTTGMINTLDNPMFVEREMDTSEGEYYEDKLLMTLDIDKDRFPEMIYKCEAFWGPFYRVYSFRNGKWTLVLETSQQSSC